jgi:hypothetical protein
VWRPVGNADVYADGDRYGDRYLHTDADAHAD